MYLNNVLVLKFAINCVLQWKYVTKQMYDDILTCSDICWITKLIQHYGLQEYLQSSLQFFICFHFLGKYMSELSKSFFTVNIQGFSMTTVITGKSKVIREYSE